MNFDTENNIVKLCAAGMEAEGEGMPEKANDLFAQAWAEANTPTEKFIAAHYFARHRSSVAEKLKWDELSITHALLIPGEEIKSTLPSLYLNAGKCYEELHDLTKAKNNYELAAQYLRYLPDDGYGNMIRGGVMNAIDRISKAG